jgi:2'-5' RNA ligase
VVFYKGGDLSDREQDFLDNIGRRGDLVKEFGELDKLKDFLRKIKSKKSRFSSVADMLKRCAKSIYKESFPHSPGKGDFYVENLDPEDKKRVREDFDKGISIIVPEGLYLRPGVETMGFEMNKGRFSDGDLKFVMPALTKNFSVPNPTLGYDPEKHTYIQKLAKVGATYSNASTQIDLPTQLSQEVMAWGKTNIPDKDLYTKDADKGREDEIHTTLFYGITEDDPEKIRDLLSGVKPFECRLGIITVFKDKKEYDVLKIDIESSEQTKLHYLIRENVKNKNDYPTYAPHLTIAYMKKGKGDKFIGEDRFRGVTFTVTEIVFSTKDHNKIRIPLGL